MPCRENWRVICSLVVFCCRGGPRPQADSPVNRTQAPNQIPLDYLDRPCKEDLDSRRPGVVCPWRPFAGTGAPYDVAVVTMSRAAAPGEYPNRWRNLRAKGV